MAGKWAAAFPFRLPRISLGSTTIITRAIRDYFEKAARKSIQDAVGMRFETRSAERHAGAEIEFNAVFDACAMRYYESRCRALNIAPILLPVVSRELSQSA